MSTTRALKRVPLEVEVDGERRYARSAVLASVMNGTSVGGGFRISPLSDASDGKLNVVVGGRLSRVGVLAMMVHILRGRHLRQREAFHWEGQRITLRWDRPVHLHLDGDLHGMARSVEVEVLPGAVTLLSA